jgi:peptidoglycan hydrolase-like protein with peptidoglycan-binding domain
MTIDWRLPERVRRPNATVCVRLVWPGATNGGVLRAEQVSAVQFALSRAGFDPGAITGRVGPRTLEAIRALRERVGIQGGGQITPDLLANLFGRTGALTGDDDAANDTACATVAFEDRQGLPIIGPAVGAGAAGAGAALVAPRPEQGARPEPRVARPAPRPDAAQPPGNVTPGDPAPRAPAGRTAPAPTARPDPRGREPRVVIAPATPPGDFGPRVAPSGRVLPPSEQRPRAERPPPHPRVVSPRGQVGERVRVVRPVRPPVVDDDDDMIVVYRRPGTVLVQPGPVVRRPPVVHGRPRYVYREWGWGGPPRVYVQPW